MPIVRIPPALPVAIALALGGCAAAPLAQIAVSQMAAYQAAPQPACTAGPECQTVAPGGAFGDISKGIGNSLHRLTSLASESQAVPPPAPAK